MPYNKFDNHQKNMSQTHFKTNLHHANIEIIKYIPHKKTELF